MSLYRLTTLDGPVIVETNGQDTPEPIVYRGTPEAVEVVSAWLQLEVGARGRLIGERATEHDLAVAMASWKAEMFHPQRIRRRHDKPAGT